jgi:DNA repair protein RadC
MPRVERPRERLVAHGAGALSGAELLALVLGSGRRGHGALALARALLDEAGGLARLARRSFDGLAAHHGIGAAKAARIAAAFELGRRALTEDGPERPCVRTPADAAALLVPEMGALPREHVRALLLDTRSRLIRTVELYRGSLHQTPVRVAEVFGPALAVDATRLVLAHNHPSGDPQPSADDVRLTRRLVEAGRLLEVEVVDHLVIGGARHVSLRAERLGFE